MENANSLKDDSNIGQRLQSIESKTLRLQNSISSRDQSMESFKQDLLTILKTATSATGEDVNNLKEMLLEIVNRVEEVSNSSKNMQQKLTDIEKKLEATSAALTSYEERLKVMNEQVCQLDQELIQLCGDSMQKEKIEEIIHNLEKSRLNVSETIDSKEYVQKVATEVMWSKIEKLNNLQTQQIKDIENRNMMARKKVDESIEFLRSLMVSQMEKYNPTELEYTLNRLDGKTLELEKKCEAMFRIAMKRKEPEDTNERKESSEKSDDNEIVLEAGAQSTCTLTDQCDPIESIQVGDSVSDSDIDVLGNAKNQLVNDLCDTFEAEDESELKRADRDTAVGSHDIATSLPEESKLELEIQTIDENCSNNKHNITLDEKTEKTMTIKSTVKTDSAGVVGNIAVSATKVEDKSHGNSDRIRSGGYAEGQSLTYLYPSPSAIPLNLYLPRTVPSPPTTQLMLPAPASNAPFTATFRQFLPSGPCLPPGLPYVTPQLSLPQESATQVSRCVQPVLSGSLLDPSSDVKEELPGLAILIPKYYKDPSGKLVSTLPREFVLSDLNTHILLINLSCAYEKALTSKKELSRTSCVTRSKVDHSGEQVLEITFNGTAEIVKELYLKLHLTLAEVFTQKNQKRTNL